MQQYDAQIWSSNAKKTVSREKNSDCMSWDVGAHFFKDSICNLSCPYMTEYP